MPLAIVLGCGDSALCPPRCSADDAAFGDGDNRAPARSRLALLDVPYVLQHYAEFQRRRAEIEAGAALAEVVGRQRQREMKELAQRLSALQAGSPEHTELDLTVLRRTRELKNQLDAARQKCAAAEARAAADAYREIVRVTDRYLDETDYLAVLRQSRTERENAEPSPSGAAPPEHQRLGRSLIVGQGGGGGGVDISDEILRRLNSGHGPPEDGRESRQQRRPQPRENGDATQRSTTAQSGG